jgi:tRNA (cytidine/uridine-2'-O-)-methyltransferase
LYTDVKYKKGDFLVFGRETKGLPEDFLHQHWDNAVTIPMKKDQRSLNLSNSVAIAVYEAVRQCNVLL